MLLFYSFLISKEFKGSRLGFSTRQDILVLRDKGIYVPYLSWAKGTQIADVAYITFIEMAQNKVFRRKKTGNKKVTAETKMKKS